MKPFSCMFEWRLIHAVLGLAFDNVRGRLFPIIGMFGSGAHVRVHFKDGPKKKRDHARMNSVMLSTIT